MALTELTLKNAKPTTKAYKLSDGGGLYLLVTPQGGKYWRLKYRSSAQPALGLGSYAKGDITRDSSQSPSRKRGIAQQLEPKHAM